MTITYTLQVSTSNICTFGKLLLRWRGSLYKIMWREIFMFIVLYYALNLSYRFLMDKQQKEIFEQLSVYCDGYTQYIPLTFLLGFYLSLVYNRWWSQFEGMAWPDRVAMLVATYIHGNDFRGRLLRRTCLRYLNLSFVLTLRMMSTAVLKRFPTMDHLVDAGFLNKEELMLYEAVQSQHPTRWVPVIWTLKLLNQAFDEKRIKHRRELLEIVKEVCQFSGRCRDMTFYNWISVPLVYTQVVTMAVYSFFLACLFGRQFLEKSSPFAKGYDFYVPFFTILQLMFYMGWMKVAEVLINPFGEDEDDFEVNFILERNLQLSYTILDQTSSQLPELVPDIHFEVKEAPVPHTVASFGLQSKGFGGSVVDIRIPRSKTDILVDTEYNPELEDNYELGRLMKTSAAGSATESVFNNATQGRAGFGFGRASQRSQRRGKSLIRRFVRQLSSQSKDDEEEAFSANRASTRRVVHQGSSVSMTSMEPSEALSKRRKFSRTRAVTDHHAGGPNLPSNTKANNPGAGRDNLRYRTCTETSDEFSIRDAMPILHQRIQHSHTASAQADRHDEATPLCNQLLDIIESNSENSDDDSTEDQKGKRSQSLPSPFAASSAQDDGRHKKEAVKRALTIISEGSDTAPMSPTTPTASSSGSAFQPSLSADAALAASIAADADEGAEDSRITEDT